MPEEIEVPTEHLHETLKEHAEEQPVRWIGKAALSAALVAVAAAIASLLAGHNANEAMLEQMQATDQWAFYQAKGIKAAVLETRFQLLEAMGKPVAAGEQQKLAAYDEQQHVIEEQGHELERSSQHHMQRHSVLARSVTIFQISIAMAAIAVLVRKRPLWFLSMAFGAAGAWFLVRGIS
jgi:DNA polymerase II large subunit